MVSRIKLTILSLSSLIVVYGLVGGMLDKVSARDDAYRDLSVFSDVLSKIRDEYVENPDMSHALEGALHGMMEALDPYSSFVDAETYSELKGREDDDATPGLVVSKRYGYVYIVSVDEGSSAQQQGLRTGDLIESIEGQQTTVMSLWEAQHRLMGPAGSSVDLRVIRSRRSEPYEVSLTRHPITPMEVTARIMEGNVGLLRIPGFLPGTADAVKNKLRLLASSGAEGLLVDVRGTAEGEVEEAVAASDAFLPPGSVISVIVDRSGNKTEYRSENEAVLTGIPVILLVDGGTSGAAEVFAASLVDSLKARTVGERTNGLGTLQNEFVLEGGSVLIISTQVIDRPTGEPLQAAELRDSGIEPDVRAPTRDFVTNFYFDNATEDETELGEGFFRSLDKAIEQEQLQAGIEEVKKVIEKSRHREAA